VVGNGDGGHIELFGLFDEVFDFDSPVQKAVFCMVMQ
jgi:hypothetical protein